MRGAWIISAIGIVVVGMLFLSQSQWAEAAYRLMVEGSIAGLWLLGAAGLGAGVLRLLRVRTESAALAFTTATGLGLGLVSLLTLGLGLAGVLNRGSAIGMIAIGLCAGAFVVRGTRIQLPALNGLLLLLMPGLAIALAGAFTLPGVLWHDEPPGYDVMAYHFQVPREWYALGRILPLGHNVFSYFPFNMEMHYLLAMHLRGGAYAGMYLAQLMHLALVALSVVAVMGAFENPRSKVLAALVMGSLPWLMMIAPVGYNEGGLLLFGSLAIVWSVRASLPSPHPLPEYQERGLKMVIAGVMAGFACGCKLTGVPVLLIGIPLFGIILRRFSIKSGLWYFVVGVLTLSPWLIRNQIWVGNPIFPEAANLLGKGHFTEDQIARWHDAHEPAIGGVDRAAAIWWQILDDWRWGFAFFPIAVLAFFLDRRRSEMWFLAGLLLVQLVFWVGFTHVQSRFFILAAPIAAMMIASIDALRWRVFATAGAIICAAVGWSILGPRVYSVLAVPPSLGLDDYLPVMRNSILPEDVAAAVYDDQRPIVLIGEAQAFWYSIPMSRLHYRGVFDVVNWIDPDMPADALIVVIPSELDRLNQHYTHLPPLPPELQGHDKPFILRRQGR